MKKLLTLVACLLCLGMTTQARHYDNNDCGSCHKRSCGTCVKKDDCGATCKRDVQTEERQGYIECPETKTITVYKKVPVTQTREKITETCVCPAPKVGYTEWSKASCPNKNCGHCESCMHRKHHARSAEVVVTEGASNDNKEAATQERKQAKSEKRGMFRNKKAAA